MSVLRIKAKEGKKYFVSAVLLWLLFPFTIAVLQKITKDHKSVGLARLVMLCLPKWDTNICERALNRPTSILKYVRNW